MKEKRLSSLNLDTYGKICKLCEEPLPVRVLHFSNLIAVENGFCCYMCMSSHLGSEKAMKIIQSAIEAKNTPGNS